MFSVLTLRVNIVLCHFGPEPMQNLMLVLELEHLTEGETVVQQAVSASHSFQFVSQSCPAHRFSARESGDEREEVRTLSQKRRVDQFHLSTCTSVEV